MANPELMMRASSVNAPMDCANTMVLQTHARRRNSADSARMATRHIRQKMKKYPAFQRSATCIFRNR